ncbi:MAG: aldehyde dehydrogenase, partial [Rhizobiales bacterium]|nr:aldehyde dehydrogenase [Hyphomicrobiales bacterium]
ATGKPWAVMPDATPDVVDRAVRSAHRAFHDDAWRGLTATQRGKLLMKLADCLAEATPAIAEIETIDTGKVIHETASQIAYIVEYFRYFGGLADKFAGQHLPIDKKDVEVWLRREPIGVVAAIIPWNSQLFLTATKLGPALAAGCTVVLKASEEAPGPLLEFARAFDKAGFPPGVLNVITGRGADCGIALTSHPLIARIAFTGGPETARHIIRNSAANLAVTSLELGGKSPVVVFDDAGVESTASAIVAGIFAAAGQSCVAGSRLIVQRRIKDALLSRVIEKAQSIRIGDPSDPKTQVGPLGTRRQRDYIEKIVAESIAAGARLLCGGKRPEGVPDGWFYLPTILDCSTINTPSVMHELFGPVLSVLTFDTEDEALRLANDSEYGLGSGIFTQNLSRAHRMAAKIKAGVVWINTYRAISPLAPFGGFGLSGYGRESGAESIYDYTRTKSVWLRTSDDPIPDPFVMR